MKGGPIVVIVLVCSVALTAFLQQQATSQRFEDRQRDFGASYLKREKLPTGGFDALVADFIWMKTILRRTLKLPADVSEDEKKALVKRDAEQNFVAYSSVVSLDPTFEKAYNFAMLRVMTDLPEEAIKIAELGINYCPKSKKDIAEFAGHIASTVRKDPVQALSFYNICVEGGPHKDYLGNRYMRILMKTKGINPDEEGMDAFAKKILFYHNHHLSLVNNAANGEGGPVLEEGKEVEVVSGPGSSWVQPLVVDQIKSFMNKALSNEVDKRTLGQIKNIYESYRTSEHSCLRCFHEYEAGDRFCIQCGFKLGVYGACLRDGTVLRGHFCHVCGLKQGQKPD